MDLIIWKLKKKYFNPNYYIWNIMLLESMERIGFDEIQ